MHHLLFFAADCDVSVALTILSEDSKDFICDRHKVSYIQTGIKVRFQKAENEFRGVRKQTFVLLETLSVVGPTLEVETVEIENVLVLIVERSCLLATKNERENSVVFTAK